MAEIASATQLCALGASPDTGNLGVSALAESIISGVAQKCPAAGLTIFDDGWGLRRSSITVDGRPFSYSLCGIRRSRRYHRPESMFNIALRSRLGLRSEPLQAIREADAVLDISGGDSFSDIYGRDQFKTTAQAKEIVLGQKRPLVLLPQTYAPFASESCRRTATRILREASGAWARDADSFEVLRDLLGLDFDPARHRLGVDIAFALTPVPIRRDGGAELVHSDRPLAGVNVSGLLSNDFTYGRPIELGLDYRKTMLSLVKRLAADGAKVLLVPHVHGEGASQSDRSACARLLEQLDRAEAEQVTLIPDGLSAGETKWVIGHCNWFCGTRMHSAIAALSQGVPTAGIAYSAKTAGVFGECGQRHQVVDSRHQGDEEVLESLWQSWLERDRICLDLALKAPAAVRRAQRQWDEILSRPGS